jgi:hypothetical protein
MTTSYDTDPNYPTIAAAWASSPLGELDTEVGHGFDVTRPVASIADPDEPATAKRVMVAAGVVCAIAAGALTGVMIFFTGDSAQPTVTVPAPDPRPAVQISPSTAALAPEQRTASTGVHPAPQVAPRPAAPGPSNIATPPPAAPQPDTTVVVDIPPLPENPTQPDPEPPKPADPDHQPPKPPVLDFPDFKLPKPEPPNTVPDLTLAPKPPKPPLIIDPVFSP